MIEVRTNQRELQIESKSTKDSCMRLIDSSSYSIWSYSEMATRKTMAVTFSKQWILSRARELHVVSLVLRRERTTSSAQNAVLRRRTCGI